VRSAIVLVGLGFGDESKGQWTDFFVRKHRARMVVRYSGGSQCGHNVQDREGRRHTFSQIGSGAMAGAHTYLDRHVVVNPHSICKEMDYLRKLGYDHHRPYIHPRCLVTTTYHQWLNHARELARDPENPLRRHGSCGHGVGEARSYWLKYGEDAVFAADLTNNSTTLRDKLHLMSQRFNQEVSNLKADWSKHPEIQGGFYYPARGEALDLRSAARMVTVAELDPFDHGELVVFEGAQGTLLDEWHGFHPHTTWSTVTAEHAFDYQIDEVRTYGLTRAYLTRHGAGPFPTFDPELTESLPDPGNLVNPWQGKLRCGWLDLPLLKYALDTWPFNGVLVSHLDQRERWKVNAHYDGWEPKPSPIPDLARQEEIGQRLAHGPGLNLVDVDERELLSRISEFAPVAGTAHGPTSNHRTSVDF